MEAQNDFDKYRDNLDNGREHQLYLKILGDFPALIWRAGTDAMCDWFNNTWLEFTGRTLEQEAGNGWAEGVHPDDLERCVAYYLDHFGRREPFRMEYRLRHRSGEYRWILDIGRPFFDLENRFHGYIGSCYDVSEEHRMVRELTELGVLRDRLAAIIGHDLKNQVGGTAGLAALILDTLPAGSPPDLREAVGAMLQSSRASLDLLQNMTHWASAQQGLVASHPRPVRLAELVDETLQYFRVLPTGKTLDILSRADSGSVLAVDPDLLATIIRNLVGNAVKFTPSGGQVVVESSRDSGGFRITVADSGPGMGEAVLKRLQQASGSVSSAAGTAGEPGTGLGLALCRTLLDLMGGRLEISSAPGQGSRFTIILPAADGA